MKAVAAQIQDRSQLRFDDERGSAFVAVLIVCSVLAVSALTMLAWSSSLQSNLTHDTLKIQFQHARDDIALEIDDSETCKSLFQSALLPDKTIEQALTLTIPSRISGLTTGTPQPGQLRVSASIGPLNDTGKLLSGKKLYIGTVSVSAQAQGPLKPVEVSEVFLALNEPVGSIADCFSVKSRRGTCQSLGKSYDATNDKCS